MTSKLLGVGLLTLAALFGQAGHAGEARVSSSSGLAMGADSHDGFTIAPAKDVPIKVYTEDLAPVQVFEIIRPDQRPFSVGRILSSCSCLDVSMDKRGFGAGERALIEVRNVKPTLPEGANYAFFIELEQPFRQALQHTVFVRSERRPAPAPSEQRPQFQGQVPREAPQSGAPSRPPEKKRRPRTVPVPNGR